MTGNKPRLGFALPQSGPWATPDNQIYFAERAEELGYDSLWTFARLLYPVGSADGHWEGTFERTFREVSEPIVTLAYIASRTSRVRLGFSALILPFYPPAVLARQLIQLDRVSAGRLLIGVAPGWSPDEFRAVGVPMERRVGRTLEYVEVMRRMWENEIASFSGEFAELPTTVVRPRPAQPRLPVLMGGSSDKALLRAGQHADGWVGPSFASPEEVSQASRRIKEAAVSVGKDGDTMQVVARGAVFLRPAGATDRPCFQGSIEEIRDDIAAFTTTGATDLFLDLNFDEEIVGQDSDPAASRDKAEQVLEAFAPARAMAVPA